MTERREAGGGAQVIDGRALATRLNQQTRAEVEAMVRAGKRAPGLAVVLVGADPASQVYVRNKARQTEAAGMLSVEHRLPADAAEATLLALVAQLNADPVIDGILVQLPLPSQIDSARVLAAIDPDKDVDGFHVVNTGRLAVGAPGLVPCTPLGCLMLLKQALGSLAGMDAVVLGRSNIVGKPMAQLLLREDCTVTVAHSRTRDLGGAVSRGGHPGGCGRARGDGARRVDQAGGGGDRRGDQPGRGGRQAAAGGGCVLCRGGGGGGLDYAGAGRGWADDDRLPAAQHVGCGGCAAFGGLGGALPLLFSQSSGA